MIDPQIDKQNFASAAGVKNGEIAEERLARISRFSRRHSKANAPPSCDRTNPLREFLAGPIALVDDFEKSIELAIGQAGAERQTNLFVDRFHTK